MDLVRIPWTPAFPPVTRQIANYDDSLGSVDEGVRLPVEEGGWAKEQRASLVLVYDPSNDEHARAIAALEGDRRFKVAAHLFNCFRVDARALGDEPAVRVKTMELRSYGADGRLLGRVRGSRHLRGAWTLLEDSFRETFDERLSRVIPHLAQLLATMARCERTINELESTLVCKRCGGSHEQVPRDLESYAARLAEYRSSLASYLATFQ
jgi:hypothetical protein